MPGIGFHDDIWFRPGKNLSGPLFWPDMGQLWAMCGSEIYFNVEIPSGMTKRCLVSVFMMIYGLGPEKPLRPTFLARLGQQMDHVRV